MTIIADLFQQPGKKLVPFLTAGYPRKDSTVDLVLAAEAGGAAMIELGMPFSDPLADGPVIQRSSQAAIANGVDLPWIFSVVRQIRASSAIPIVLMGYINPVLKMGSQRFLEGAAEAGVNGLIIPDLPPEEDRRFYDNAKEAGISTIHMVTPVSSPERMTYLGQQAQDLLYAVSLLGVTGTGAQGETALIGYLQSVRQATATPFMVGFGIKTASDVARLAPHVDGMVVGSALLERISAATDPVAETEVYIRSLVEAAEAGLS
ncbi:MAG: tryptophan synthase subunit alpha [Candidatus Marinimicrobia bacterium]|nr:tryptophan synthase subunit alpha [Candidatus Neomarinimicrobiota bacterium]